jgi:hypothetical protein
LRKTRYRRSRALHGHNSQAIAAGGRRIARLETKTAAAARRLRVSGGEVRAA